MDVNLIDLFEQYKGDDNECRKVLEALRWPEGKKCPRCGSGKTSRAMKDGHNYNCDVCHYQFTVTAGTIFHDSHLSLWTWFLAVYLMCESKKGMSANQIKRTLKVSYKTAWYLCHRIRKAMAEVYANEPKLDGIVEVDETYVGGKYDKRRKRAPWDKQAVMGLLQRKGTFEARAIPTTGKKILVGVINERINKTAGVMTDEYAAYRGIDKTYDHESICHSKEEWVRGDVYTNGVENAWSLFKRSIVGSFHHVSEKHIDQYLNEFDWRFNGRDNPHLFRDTLVRLLNSPKMEFKELIDKTA
jgi:transposase-like protein